MKNIALLSLLFVLVVASFAIVNAQELEITLDEKINAQAEGDGMYVAFYNITGGQVSIIVNNSNSNYMVGENDTKLADIWVPINDSQSALLYNSCRINNISTATTDEIISNTTGNPCAAQMCKIVSNGLSDCFCLGSGAATTVNKTEVLSYNEHLNGTSNYDYVIHINALNSSKQATILCDLNTTAMQNINASVFSFAETYTPTKIVNNGCTAVTVALNVTNNYTSSCNISATIQKKLATRGTGTSWGNLTFDSASEGATIDNTANGANATWSGLTFTPSETKQFTFVVNACPNMTANTSKLEMGRVHISFNLANKSCASETKTGIKIGHVSAVGSANIEPQKGYNGTSWNETATFYNSATDLNYTIYSMRVWATNGTIPPANPNDASISGSEWANCLAASPSSVANGSNVACNGVQSFQFNGTPVVWARPLFELSQGGNRGWQTYVQFGNSENASLPLGSDYMFIEKIWIVNDYLIRTAKRVIPSSQPGCYNISINVTNMGPSCSPYVYIYDIIPRKFNESVSDVVVFKDTGTGVFSNSCVNIAKPGNAVTNMSQGYLLSFADPSASEVWNLVNCVNTFNKSQYTGKQITSGNYSGTGYYWKLFPLAGSVSGGECVNGKYTNLENMSVEQSVMISYTTCANANDTYYASDLFIVGVDPANVEGNAAPPLSTGLSVLSESAEIWIILAVFIVLGAFIYFYVKRKQKKNE